ncbi:MAG: hypothetical protein N3B18_00430, partial [Desulfobacterota bacterium]|nr:hypothetical protein [Thermodesulfobacteriota bacterium]
MQHEEFPHELIADDTQAGAPEEIAQSLYGRILAMSVPEKIKLAMIGNREARALLIRDANRVVAEAVLTSPRLTLDEVASYAANRNLASDIIRAIAERKEFLKHYPIRLALVHNPKTPVPQALQLLETLREHDIKAVAKNRNIPSAVSQAAARA